MKEIIIVYPLLTWDSDLIHRDQMLSKEFAKRGVDTYFIDRISKKPWKILGEATTRQCDGVKVLGVFVLPYLRGKFPFIYKLNNYFIGRQLKTTYQQIPNPKTFYISNPDWAEHVSKISGDNKVIYDISDDYARLTTNVKWSKIVTRHDLLAKRIASKLVATNRALLERVEGNKPTAIVSNGVDLEGFSTAKPVIKNPQFGKIVGFIGGIYTWVDLELFEKVAKALPEDYFVLIGPTDRGNEIDQLVKRNTNIVYLGKVDKGEISNYFASLDVGLVPFVSESIYPRLRSVDSGKIYQYLYFGSPVVSTSYSQSRDLSEIVRVADTETAFISKVKSSLDEDRSIKSKQFAVENNWVNKASEIIKFINK